MTQEIENEIQDKGLDAPRVTFDQIEALMSQLKFDFTKVGAKGTLCSSYLGDFMVTQHYSAPVCVKNYNKEIGEKITKDVCWAKSKDKLWELMGFALFKELNSELFSD